MPLRVYLDTSVFSVAFDDRSPERRALTQEFLTRARATFELSSSEIALSEINHTPDESRRRQMIGLYSSMFLVAVSPESVRLAAEYLTAQIFTHRQQEDAMHVAVAVCSRQDVLVSWNFRHLVNRERRARVLALNAAQGYPPIEILSPPEI